MVRNCAPENLEIPGSVLSDRPGMTERVAVTPANHAASLTAVPRQLCYNGPITAARPLQCNGGAHEGLG